MPSFIGSSAFTMLDNWTLWVSGNHLDLNILEASVLVSFRTGAKV